MLPFPFSPLSFVSVAIGSAKIEFFLFLPNFRKKFFRFFFRIFDPEVKQDAQAITEYIKN